MQQTAFLRLWYKFEGTHLKFSRFVRFTFWRKIGVPEFDRNVFITRKVNMRVLFELVSIPQRQESIGCCMTFPDFLFAS